MKKILFVIGSLQVGGAETVLVDILNNINKEFEITLLLIEKKGKLQERLTDNIKIKYLTNGEKSDFISRIYNKIKKSLLYRFLGKNKFYVSLMYKFLLKEKYDSEIAFLPGLPARIVKNSPNKNSKKISWIHSETTDNSNTDHLTIYKGFNIIVGNCKSSIESFKKFFPNYEGKIKLLYNYIDINKIINLSNEEENIDFNSNTINFVSVGRIVEVKGFDRIISIAKKYEKIITFNIIGTGPLEEEYKNQLKKEKINNVKFLGLKKNPYPYIKKADAFLMVSRSEAFPTVVIEAMILNKKIVGTEVLGIHEILNGYKNGIIVENNINEIIYGIDKCLENIKNKNRKSTNDMFIKRNNETLKEINKMLRSDSDE